MGCLTGCARFILVLINVIIGILWLAITVLGGLLAWGTPVVRELVQRFLGPFIESLSKQDGQTINVDSLVELILKLGNTVGIVLFVAGLILTIICFCGLFGACCDNKCLLQTFAILLTVLVAAQIIFIIIYFVQPNLFFDPARDALTNTTIYYGGLKGTNPESIIWNLIQPWQQCCGSVSANDFNNPPSKWDHKESFQVAGSSQEITVQYPVTCCLMDSQYQIKDSSCPAVFTEANSNIGSPCYTKLRSQLAQYSNIVMYIFIGIVVGQAILIAIAFAVACAKDSKVY